MKGRGTPGSWRVHVTPKSVFRGRHAGGCLAALPGSQKAVRFISGGISWIRVFPFAVGHPRTLRDPGLQPGMGSHREVHEATVSPYAHHCGVPNPYESSWRLHPPSTVLDVYCRAVCKAIHRSLPRLGCRTAYGEVTTDLIRATSTNNTFTTHICAIGTSTGRYELEYLTRGTRPPSRVTSRPERGLHTHLPGGKYCRMRNSVTEKHTSVAHGHTGNSTRYRRFAHC